MDASIGHVRGTRRARRRPDKAERACGQCHKRSWERRRSQKSAQTSDDSRRRLKESALLTSDRRSVTSPHHVVCSRHNFGEEWETAIGGSRPAAESSRTFCARVPISQRSVGASVCRYGTCMTNDGGGQRGRPIRILKGLLDDRRETNGHYGHPPEAIGKSMESRQSVRGIRPVMRTRGLKLF